MQAIPAGELCAHPAVRSHPPCTTETSQKSTTTRNLPTPAAAHCSCTCDERHQEPSHNIEHQPQRTALHTQHSTASADCRLPLLAWRALAWGSSWRAHAWGTTKGRGATGEGGPHLHSSSNTDIETDTNVGDVTESNIGKQVACCVLLVSLRGCHPSAWDRHLRSRLGHQAGLTDGTHVQRRTMQTCTRMFATCCPFKHGRHSTPWHCCAMPI